MTDRDRLAADELELYAALEEQMRTVVAINELNAKTRRRLARLIRTQMILTVLLAVALILNVGTLLYRMLA